MLHFDEYFTDRYDAGRQLAAALARFKDFDPVVLALPRGGVPVAFEVARVLRAPLDLLLARKLGAPGAPELGIGAVIDGDDPQLVLNDEAIRFVQPPDGYVAAEMQRQLAEIERRRSFYLGERAPVSVRGRAVILVDDGIATGGTARVALKALRKAGVSRLVLAIPLAPRESLQILQEEADEVICLETPNPFQAVGIHYADFTQTSDDDVVRLLVEARAFTTRKG
ncbi:phosphoribosyltransferase [Consotaella aegiceratis]|uniref:phosphoribosyltransferase n=1 Tax=Consotaella aegiceratis TaxID=3097961 RepID=UPI002F42D463